MEEKQNTEPLLLLAWVELYKEIIFNCFPKPKRSLSHSSCLIRFI